MTPQQLSCIQHAMKCIQEAGQWLYMAMYYSDEEMSDEEFSRVREAYDLLCKANDKL